MREYLFERETAQWVENENVPYQIGGICERTPLVIVEKGQLVKFARTFV